MRKPTPLELKCVYNSNDTVRVVAMTNNAIVHTSNICAISPAQLRRLAKKCEAMATYLEAR